MSGHAHESGPGTIPLRRQNRPLILPRSRILPAVEEEPPPSKVTICHHTGSKKNPDVTITVGEAAVEGLLAKGDELGACAAP